MGRPLGRRCPEVCRQCGARRSTSTRRYFRLRQRRRSGPLGAVLKPFDVLRSVGQALKRQRGIRPSPITYAVPGLVGAAAGLLLRRRLRRGAWIPAMGLPAGVWCIAAATAFTHGRARRSLREVRLHAAIGLHPEQAVQIRLRDTESQIKSCPLPLYGLPVIWEGRRFLGGWGEGPAGVNQVTLAHGDPDDGTASFLRVEVSVSHHVGDDEQLRRRLVRELRARPHRPPSGPPPFLRCRLRARASRSGR